MGDPGEKKYIKKKIRPGAIVLDPRETAIVVQYELEGQLLAPDGVTVITELSDGTKRIKVKKLDRRTDIQALADEIVTTCKLIHHSKTGKVRSLLAELRDRTANASGGAKTRKDALEVVHDEDARRSRAPSRKGAGEFPRLANTRDRDAHLSARADDPAAKTLDAIVAREDRRLLAEAKADFLGAAHDVVATTSAPLVSEIGSSGLVSRLGGRFGGRSGVGDTRNDTKSMHEHIDAHLELLYDDDPATRAEGVAGVARFAAEAKNLATLAAHETLPQTLARVLREDGRRSADIATNVMAVFFALSNASAFHGLILGNQVGDATLRVVDLELRRAAERRKTQKFTLATSFFAKSSSREDRGESTTKTTSSDDDDIDAFEARRVVSSEKKRDALLYVAFYLLLNVAEDVAVERKMKKRDVVSYLMECVGTRGDVDLLVLCVTFLRKLSVRRENVEEMLRGGVLDGERRDDVGTSGEEQNEQNEPFRDDVVARVARFLADGVPDVLVSATLRLLLNVSFHERARDAMHERALLPRLCVLARNATHANVALALLYHASVDERRRRFFAVARPVSGTDLALDALLRVSETDSVAHSAPTVAGLAVNLSADARCAEALAGYENGKPFLAFLAGRLRRKDALGLKIARNVFRRAGDANECPSVVRVVKAAIRDARIFPSLIDGFLLEDPPGTDVAIEMLGLLTDAHRPAVDEGLDASVACENAGVFERVAAYLTPHETEDDAALEAVLFCSAFASKHDARNASIFVKTGIAESLYELLREKKDDDAFVLAIVTTFAAFLAFPETRDVVLNNTQTVFYLVELLRDECAAIRDAADAALDVVVDEGGEQWAVKVRRARFEAHNREWLDTCAGGFARGDERNDERRARRYSDDEETGGGGAFDGRGGSDASLVYDDPARYYDEAEEDDMYGY